MKTAPIALCATALGAACSGAPPCPPCPDCPAVEAAEVEPEPDQAQAAADAPESSTPLPPAVPGERVELPAPKKSGGEPLMEALAARQSTRQYADRPIGLERLSRLLWAATGVSREDSGKRTAPTARDRRDLTVYVAAASGLFYYLPDEHALEAVKAADVRAATGKQEFVADAPINLVYVSDLSVMGDTPLEQRHLYAGSHAGFVAQNVYLFCASEGLATVVRAYFDRDALTAALDLGPDQLVVLAQTIGHPAQ